jgi:tetrahydromethanopterin S-methyltransferase subunit B
MKGKTTMVIHHSKQLLEELSEVEEKIQHLERLMDELKIECDREGLIKSLLAKRYGIPSGQ